MRVVSGTVVTEYVIKPCLGGSKLRYENFDTPFEEFPFDIDISIDSKADYVVCFDEPMATKNRSDMFLLMKTGPTTEKI